jgi:hypothetical protein
MSVYVKQGTSPTIGFDFFNVASGPTFTFATASWSTVAGFTTTVQNVGNGWYRISAAAVSSTTNGGPGWKVSGTTTAFIWGAQLELGSTATPYQRVTTQYDVTEAGVQSCSYLFFDGADSMATGTITPGTDKAQVFAGVLTVSAATFGAIVELSTTGANAEGAFSLLHNSSNQYSFSSRGNAAGSSSVTGTLGFPDTSVLAGTSEISADQIVLRRNGSPRPAGTGDQGTGNYLAYPLYIGRRGGTSLPFSGNIFSLITRFGANLDAPTIASTEAYVAGKTGITI